MRIERRKLLLYSVVAVVICGGTYLLWTSVGRHPSFPASSQPLEHSDNSATQGPSKLAANDQASNSSKRSPGDTNGLDDVAVWGADPIALMDMEWDSRRSVSLFGDKAQLAEAVTRLPISGAKSAAKEQVASLQDLLIEMLYGWGNNKGEAYYDFLEKSGERVRPEVVSSLRQELEQAGQLPPDKSVSDWNIVRAYSERLKVQSGSHWHSLVGEGSSIRVYGARTVDQRSWEMN